MELNTIQTEATWNEIADRLNDNFNKIATALNGETDNVVSITLDVSKLSGSFNITEEQRNSFAKARQGYTVVIVDSNNTYNGEWGQVISCYRQYMGSGIYSLRLSILHKDNAPMSTNDRAMIYNIDIMDYMFSGAYDCTVTSINNLY